MRDQSHIYIAVKGPGRNFGVKLHPLNLNLPEGGLRGLVAALENLPQVDRQFRVLCYLPPRALVREIFLILILSYSLSAFPLYVNFYA